MSPDELLWPRYESPADLAAIEAVPLAERGLPESTYALLVRAAERAPERTALTVLPDAERWEQPVRESFAELLARVHRYANLLYSSNIRRGDPVALLAPNCDALIAATLAAQLAGIAAPVNGGLSRPHIAALLQLGGARVLIAAGPELSAEQWSAGRALAADGLLDTLLALRPTGAGGEPPALEPIPGVAVGYLDELAAGHDDRAFADTPPRSGDLAALFHTGGTTGLPKLAAHTHANEVANAWMIAANSLLGAESVVFAALPLFHVNAVVVTLLAPLFRGQPVVWAGPLGYRDPALYGHFWRIVEHYRIAAMSAVPTVYAVLTHCPLDADITSLRYAMVGASPLPPAVREGFQRHTGVTLVEGYGLTEATCVTARSFPDHPRPGAVGQRMPYQRVAVSDAGTLTVAGPTVFAGYLSTRDARGPVLRPPGDRLDTGDLADVDSEGFIYLRGRAKDLIIRGGHNIDPAVIEDALLAHPAVTAAGAVGRPDPHAGEVPVAYVTLAAGTQVSEAELLDWARARVGEPAAAPKAVTVLDALPVTDVGKPYKLGLRADAAARELTEALAGIGVDAGAAVVDGAVVATVEVTEPADEATVRAVLARYPLATRIAVRR
ncbi:acyl-CoA synthetase [Nocardia sp. NPDC050697]|uniref:acyl-CoA synthetase n=1 Tax=Nocardia sp. NPDC050697 TaxID=3155158 RepID=UPI0033D97798